MDLRTEIKRQRVKYIISSYQLHGDEAEFDAGLDRLLAVYTTSVVELALVEVLVDEWLRVPMLRGCELLIRVDQQLQCWQDSPIVTRITPTQFQQITGLDPNPVFGSSGSAPYSIAQ